MRDHRKKGSQNQPTVVDSVEGLAEAQEAEVVLEAEEQVQH